MKDRSCAICLEEEKRICLEEVCLEEENLREEVCFLFRRNFILRWVKLEVSSFHFTITIRNICF